MTNTRIGKLTPRYLFILNQYPNERLSKCPRCNRPTHARKFALFIYIDDWGPIALGKTCRYCSRCELMIAHQHEIEDELAHHFSQIAPQVIGSEYRVLGTMDKKVWKTGLAGPGVEFDEMLKHVADFKAVLDLIVEPGGWYPADQK